MVSNYNQQGGSFNKLALGILTCSSLLALHMSWREMFHYVYTPKSHLGDTVNLEILAEKIFSVLEVTDMLANINFSNWQLTENC